jgi:hypothetical protein
LEVLLPAAFCVTSRVPQAVPEQPVPASDQLMTVFGFDPVTGVSVAITGAVVDVLTVPGAVS